MKLLLDSCLSPRLAAELRAAGHDVVAAAEWPGDPGDPEILEFAAAEGRVLITLDKDFGSLAVLQRLRHFGIIRLNDQRVRQYAAVCLEALRLHGAALSAGAILMADSDRLRLRMPPTDA